MLKKSGDPLQNVESKSNRQNHLERRGIFNFQDYVLRNGVIFAEDIVDKY